MWLLKIAPMEYGIRIAGVLSILLETEYLKCSKNLLHSC
jgi:hypothetical protein